MKLLWLHATWPRSLCLGLALWAQKTPVAGQNSLSTETLPGQAGQDDQTKITLDVTRVNILFTVTDKKGRFVTDLTQNDFQIVENKKPQTIQQFTAESDLPLRLAVLVDTSNSIRSEFKFEQEAAVRFMQSVMRPTRGPHDAGELRQRRRNGYRPDRAINEGAGTRAFSGMRPGGGTSLYDAIYFASKEKLMMDRPRDKFRRAMIVISDGEDTASRNSRDQALEMAQKAGRR